jgi:DNA-binding NarL/FixJ family response regulator
MLRLVLADDHPVVRAAIKTLLERHLPATVVGEAGDGVTALALVEALAPDGLLVDLQMPGLSGLDVVRAVRAAVPAPFTVVLSMHSDAEYVREALRCGASGYVLKDAATDELLRAVHAAAAGRRYLSSALSEHAIEAYIQQAEAAAADGYDRLTDRERQVLRLAAEGLSGAEVAERLVLSPRTVETYRAQLMHKLALHNQTELVLYAVRRGIVPLHARGPGERPASRAGRSL